MVLFVDSILLICVSIITTLSYCLNKSSKSRNQSVNPPILLFSFEIVLFILIPLLAI